MLFWEEVIETVGETGRLMLAAVDGFMSWWGEGCRFMEADCIVEAISTGRLDIMRIVRVDLVF